MGYKIDSDILFDLIHSELKTFLSPLSSLISDDRRRHFEIAIGGIIKMAGEWTDAEVHDARGLWINIDDVKRDLNATCFARREESGELIALESIEMYAEMRGRPSAQPEILACGEGELIVNPDVPDINVGDMISRQAAIDYFVINVGFHDEDGYPIEDTDELRKIWTEYFDGIPSAQPDLGKYEYHYDHTDCIWYRPEARNRCPATCAQYRDGWNDAMNYIFRDGEGYRPFRRDKKYEG